MEGVDDLLRNISRLHLQKLARNYDECETHAEYNARNANLDRNAKAVIDGLEKADLKNSLVDDTEETVKGCRIAIITALYNLYLELLCNCSWNTEKARDYARKINRSFEHNCEVKLHDVLRKNDVCDSQTVFDKLLEELCPKLTAADFKKYPGQVEVYNYLMLHFKDFDVTLDSLRVLPVALNLIDDYIVDNKIKGLKCCLALLKSLTAKDFETGNYYEVIYISLKGALGHSSMKVTELTQNCYLELCPMYPNDVKEEKLDAMYTDALEQISSDPNLYRKAALYRYIKKVMEIMEIKCVGKPLFKTVVCETIESCMVDAVAEVLLMPALECLEEWIKYCWPVWKLPVDSKILCTLLKFYSKSKLNEGGLFVQKLIVTLVALCSPEEQRHFEANLVDKDGEQFSKLGELRRDIGV